MTDQWLFIVALYLPIGLVYLAHRNQPLDKRQWLALFFSGCWLTASLIFITEIGEALRFWSFHCSTYEKALIMTVWIEWWLTLSLLPILFNGRGYQYYHSLGLGVAAYLLDLVVMPQLEPWIQLHPHWEIADFVLCLCLYTSLQISRTTVRKTTFYKRNLFLGFTLIISTFWLPMAVIEENALFFLDLPPMHFGWLGCGAGLWMAHQAAYDFATKGRGTPFPLDPPKQLVTTGVYGWVRSPMQAGFILTAISWCFIVAHWATLFLPISLVIYSVGYCKKQEEEDLEKRFGAEYRQYRRRTGYWLPRLGKR